MRIVLICFPVENIFIHVQESQLFLNDTTYPIDSYFQSLQRLGNNCHTYNN